MAQDAAVLQTVREALENTSVVMPGHRFSLYLPFWIAQKDHKNRWEKAPDLKEDEGAKLKALRSVVDDARQDVVRKLIDKLRARQNALAQRAGAEMIEAQSLSPFVTGMGEEHAVENGFAFLSPYGLPYLAGSGVKGVIRRAAEELAEMGEHGWSFARVAWLFGYEDNAYVVRLDEERENVSREAQALFELLNGKNAVSFDDLSDADKHLAGALSFWDVIIDGALGVDILTPHYGEYYQGKEPPHDAGQPQPNPFLVVAPGARFAFHVTCAEHRSLPETIKNEWRSLIRAAFDHAFEWGGFGAKTAVGYGVLVSVEHLQALEAEKKAREQRQREQARKEAEENKRRIRVGDRVLDPDSEETGIVVNIKGDMAEVDFDGTIDEISIESLRKLT